MLDKAPSLGMDGNLSLAQEAAIELKQGKSYQLFILSMPMRYSEDQTKDFSVTRCYAFLPNKKTEEGFVKVYFKTAPNSNEKEAKNYQSP